MIQNSTTGNLFGVALYPNFDAQPAIIDDVLVKYTYYGDSNLDGKVDGTDYGRTDASFLSEKTGPSVTGWFNSDFNYDNTVNGSHYTLLDNAFNSQGAQIAAQLASPTAQLAGSGATSAAEGSASAAEGSASAVPEPASCGLLGIGAIGLLGRRARSRRSR